MQQKYGGSVIKVIHINQQLTVKLPQKEQIVHIVQDEVLDQIDIIYGVTVHACPIGIEYDHKQRVDKDFYN